MDRVLYERDFDNELKNDGVSVREAKKIAFNIPNDLNIYEFRIMSIRLAQSLGYDEDSIYSAFGDIDTPYYLSDDDLEIRKHIFDLTHDPKKIDKFIQNNDIVEDEE